MEHAKLATGVELCYELRGQPGDPVVVLIAGLGRQLIGWDDAFCELLVAQGFRVLRFDNRDAGLSTQFDDGPSFDLAAARHGGADAVAYTLDDMADDTVALLDVLHIDRAHMVGTSMGGMIAQALAIRHPARLLSLCSIMSTTGADDVGRPQPEALAVIMDRPPAQRDAYVAFELANCRVIGSQGALADEDWRRDRFERFFDRGIHPAGTGRQIMAMVGSGSRAAALAGVTAPTLVIHGDIDPLVPLDGGEATVRAVPGAQLLVIPDMGHEIPPAVQPRVVAAIVANARRAAEGTPSSGQGGPR